MLSPPRIAAMGPSAFLRAPLWPPEAGSPRTGANESELCFHCAAPVPSGARWRAQIDGAEQPFCCAGCLGIAQTIRAAGLTDFYARRTGRAETPANAPDEWTHYDIAAEAHGLI